MTKNKISKIYNIQRNGFFRVKYGTTDKNNPSVIYLRCKSDIKPYIDKKSYSDDVTKIKRELSNIIKEEIKNINNIIDDKKFLFDIDITDNTIAYNKKSRLNINLYICPFDVKPLEYYEKTMSELIDRIEIRTNACINKNCISFK